MIKNFYSPRLTMSPTSQIDWWTPNYISKVVKWLNDPEVMKYSEQRHWRHTELTQYAYLEDREQPYWAIFVNDPQRAYPQIVGTISADVDKPNERANLAIMIGREYWGQGYGKEAWKAAMRHLIACGTRKIEAGMMASNIPMIKTAQACGMREEGRIREHFLWQGDPMDLVLMGATE